MIRSTVHLLYGRLCLFQERNRPKQPPKVPKAAPFFLPTIPGLEPKFAIPEENEKEKVRCVFAIMCNKSYICDKMHDSFVSHSKSTELKK